MKTLVTTILILFSTSMFAQYPDTTVDSATMEKQAEEITEQYNSQLALTGIQLPLFKKKVEHYLILAEEIKMKKDGKAELDTLVQMQAQETLEMNDILTQPQYRLYKKIKYKIQPLKIVDKQ